MLVNVQCDDGWSKKVFISKTINALDLSYLIYEMRFESMQQVAKPTVPPKSVEDYHKLISGRSSETPNSVILDNADNSHRIPTSISINLGRTSENVAVLADVVVYEMLEHLIRDKNLVQSNDHVITIMIDGYKSLFSTTSISVIKKELHSISSRLLSLVEELNKMPDTLTTDSHYSKVAPIETFSEKPLVKDSETNALLESKKTKSTKVNKNGDKVIDQPKKPIVPMPISNALENIVPANKLKKPAPKSVDTNSQLQQDSVLTEFLNSLVSEAMTGLNVPQNPPKPKPVSRKRSALPVDVPNTVMTDNVETLIPFTSIDVTQINKKKSKKELKNDSNVLQENPLQQLENPIPPTIAPKEFVIPKQAKVPTISKNNSKTDIVPSKVDTMNIQPQDLENKVSNTIIPGNTTQNKAILSSSDSSSSDSDDSSNSSDSDSDSDATSDNEIKIENKLVCYDSCKITYKQ